MRKLLFAMLLLCSLSAQAQISFTAALPHCLSAPTGPPSASGSRIRLDMSTGKLWEWSPISATWLVLGQGIDQIVGCVAPSYTPGIGQSDYVINTCTIADSVKLYHWTGSAWQRILGGSGGGSASVTTDATLSGSGTSGSPLKIAQQSASSGQVLKWNGTTWAPGTDNNTGTTYTAGTGIAINGSNVISNTAPDQTVSITGGGINSVSGAYPNFTVTGTEVDGSTTNELNTSLLVTGGNLRLTDAGGNKDVAVTDIAPIQALTAGSGISISGTSNKTVVLGNDVGSTSANFTNDREIPTNSNKLIVSGVTKSVQFRGSSSNNYVQISPDSTSSGNASIQIVQPSTTSAFERFFMRIDPPTKNSAQSAFNFGISNNTQSGTDANNVMMFGWNLSPGGSKVDSRKPYIGESWEHNYRPAAPTAYPRYIEKHEIYMPSYNTRQRRLSSYTITETATGANTISLYHTADVFSLRDTTFSDYFSVSGNLTAKTAQFNMYANRGAATARRFAIAIDSTNNTITQTWGGGNGSNWTNSGFFQYILLPYTGPNLLTANCYAGLFDAQFGDDSKPGLWTFKNSDGGNSRGVIARAATNTTASLTSRGNLFLESYTNTAALGTRSDINMTYWGTSGSAAIRANVLQVGPAAGTALPTGTPLQVNSNAANTQSLVRLQTTTDSVRFFVHGATPEGSITGRVGDISIGKVSGAGSVYIKTSGENTNTGWTQVSTGAAGNYQTMQEEGSDLTQRAKLNFVGSTATAADNSGSSRTDVTFDSDVNALASTSTTGIYAITGSGTSSTRTITAGTGISISNGSGVSGNPTITNTGDTNASDDITGSGTSNQVAYFNGTQTVTSNSSFGYNGITVTTTNDMTVNGITVGKGASAISTNTVFGVGGLAAITTGVRNSAFGEQTLPVATSAGANTAIGSTVLNKCTTCANNVGLGISALQENINGNSNMAIGFQVLKNATAPGTNVAIGASTMQNGTGSPSDNTAIGTYSMLSTTGSRNVGIGLGTLQSQTSGTQNVAIGNEAGFSITTTSGGLFLGYQAGYNETTGNKLYIDNSNTATPLIGGDFANNRVGINVAPGSIDASAALEIASTTQGVLFPRMTTTQRDAIASPANGLVIYNSSTDKLQVRAAGAWVDHVKSGTTTGTTSAAGKLTITHGLGAAPSVVTATYIGDNAYFCTITNKGATTFDVKVWDAAGAAVASTSVTVDWISR